MMMTDGICAKSTKTIRVLSRQKSGVSYCILAKLSKVANVQICSVSKEGMRFRPFGSPRCII